MSPDSTDVMYCWSCGTHLDTPGRPCPRCGTEASDLLLGEGKDVTGAGGTGTAGGMRRARSAPFIPRGCPACGFRGEGIPYFRRAGNLALLAAATLFTYGVGGAVYWLLKRYDQVCPSCGLSWKRARPLGEELQGPDGEGSRTDSGPVSPRGVPHPGKVLSPMAGVPGSGVGRRILGSLMALSGLLLVGIGVAELEVVLQVVGGAMGLTGALTFGWGWKALQRRREAILQRMQRRILHLARARSGCLTATDVATELDLTLNAAERVLLSLDDGFRIRSDITDEGILIFEFPELQLRASGHGAREGNESASRMGQNHSDRND